MQFANEHLKKAVVCFKFMIFILFKFMILFWTH